ncbi:hypothetical protein TGRH88_056010 [Toxoplasma gondii]|uniref:Uncharacterized protein n=1 Tax=Toxoplasma gondii TaxID=5811 RepID=A0A7J6JYN9_TOXGO|nr:hypothetical protein TGRH88_056010 [Toxoplasma gondii]
MVRYSMEVQQARENLWDVSRPQTPCHLFFQESSRARTHTSRRRSCCSTCKKNLRFSIRDLGTVCRTSNPSG